MDNGLYYVALMSALAVPDIASALASDEGRVQRGQHGILYAAWYDKWARPRLRECRGRENPFTGEECWEFRCSMLHQRRFKKAGNTKGRRIVFIEPGYPNYSLHYCMVNGDAFLIQIDQFVEEIMRGCELWLEAVQDTEQFKKNYEAIARRHLDGVVSVIGVPIIG